MDKLSTSAAMEVVDRHVAPMLVVGGGSVLTQGGPTRTTLADSGHRETDDRPNGSWKLSG